MDDKIKKYNKVTKEYVDKIIALLKEHYGEDYVCYLNHENAWQLLIATILSAQCTDARVNIVTKDLFIKYDSPAKFAEADINELENDIRSIGFFRSKAKNIKKTCEILVRDYNGEVPKDIDELTALPGVGRKTANVIRGNIYHIPSIVVDTHVKRISNILGFTEEDEPEKIEKDLMKILPEDYWILYNIHIIRLGRSLCIARRTRCEECFLNDVCLHLHL